MNTEEKIAVFAVAGAAIVAAFYFWRKSEEAKETSTSAAQTVSGGGGAATTTPTASGQRDTSQPKPTIPSDTPSQPSQPAPTKTSTCSVIQNRTKSITFSSQPVSKPVYEHPFFEATEVTEQVCKDSSSIYYNKVINTLPAFTYLVTPADVARNPSAYPSYIVSYYKANYPSMFT